MDIPTNIIFDVVTELDIFLEESGRVLPAKTKGELVVLLCEQIYMEEQGAGPDKPKKSKKAIIRNLIGREREG